MAKDFGGPTVQETMKKVIPGLSIAIASVELADLVWDLIKSSDKLHKANLSKRDGQVEFSKEDGDEAKLLAMKNDKKTSEINVAKKSIKVTANTIELGGAIASTAGGGHGAAVGAGMSATAAAMNIASKVIFSGIDFAQAKKAMKTLEAAQAGSYQARSRCSRSRTIMPKCISRCWPRRTIRWPRNGWSTGGSSKEIWTVRSAWKYCATR